MPAGTPPAMLCVLGISDAAAGAPEYGGELILPLEKWHNHSSFIVEVPSGDFLVGWFPGSGERTADDVLIQAARWNKSTRKWRLPIPRAQIPGITDSIAHMERCTS